MNREATEEPPSGTQESDACRLGASHRLASGRPQPLASLAALDRVDVWLRDARPRFLDPPPGAAQAAEWLLDNAYLVERAAAEVRSDLPSGFYRRLPCVACPPGARVPRAYRFAHELLRATELHFALEDIVRFTNEYQEGAGPLQIGELWAIPSMLRLGCLEVLIAAAARLFPGIGAPFAVEDPALEEMALDDATSVGGAVRGLAALSSVPWRRFFECTSQVEAILGGDPAGAYSACDFDTRDGYRKAIEEIARGAGMTEADVARRAVSHARETPDGADRRAHVGYWLIDGGREAFEASLAYRSPWPTRWRRACSRHAVLLYLSALGLTTMAVLTVPGLYLYASGAGRGTFLAGIVLSLLPATMVAVAAVHRLVHSLVTPRALSKLEFAGSIPREWKTAVVVPGMLGGDTDVDGLASSIERHYLGNASGAVEFVVLTDFPDAPEPHTPADDPVLAAMVARIRALNRTYAPGASGPFHLLHRERRHNTAEGCWMGWERKRGKLEEWNRLLCGATDTTFVVHEGDPDRLQGVRFVITLDADTVLPREAAARLASILAHPLNRPAFDARSGRVCAGYTIVQPRVEIVAAAGADSLFARLAVGDATIDIYSRAVSDVYQDLFATGIYVGKGIYDVDAFVDSLAGRVPTNALASHDLFEGIHGRAALATDVVVYEHFPSHYLAFARRLHRWIRGDWQLLPWLGRVAPGHAGRPIENRLSLIDRWKVIDNLRRSLLAPALLTLLVAGWLWLPGSPLVWTLLAMLAPGAHSACDLFASVGRWRWRKSLRMELAPQAQRLREQGGRWFLLLALLPHEATIAVDAIGRTLVRMFITHERLLEWTTAATTAADYRDGRGRPWREMAVAPAIAFGVTVALVVGRPVALLAAAPLLALWLGCPALAHWISQTRHPRIESTTSAQHVFLRRLARRTWLFFEHFVGPEDQWLPPDNYQEDPRGIVAHRTSPTNIGMMLLAVFSAHDLGYVGPGEVAFRLRSALDSLRRMRRYRGHLLNWYDTRTLEPLSPVYVSTVDSGNLAACLFVAHQALEASARGAVLTAARWDGLLDALGLLEDALSQFAGTGDGHAASSLAARVASMRQHVERVRDRPEDWPALLQDLCERECPDLDTLMLEFVRERSRVIEQSALHEARIWLERVHKHLRGMQCDTESLLSWLPCMQVSPLGENAAGRPDEQAALARLRMLLAPTVALDAIPRRCAEARDVLTALRERSEGTRHGDEAGGHLGQWIDAVRVTLTRAEENAAALRVELQQLAVRARAEAMGMDFALLYDSTRRLFYIGYNVTAAAMDPHHYDLLASEARVASLFAIAKGDVPLKHWFALGRPVAAAGGVQVLLSWGGTLFEYLMPRLVLRTYEGTVLAESERAAVDVQMRFAADRGTPWGVSESGYALLDGQHNYQYRAFGVPGLGFKRGLAHDVVIAPYATALAVMVHPREAARNLLRLSEIGGAGTYGMYEAVDFTPARVPTGHESSVVRSYMAHHQGMTLAALDNHLCEHRLVDWFHADPLMQTVELLLAERPPLGVAAASSPTDEAEEEDRPPAARTRLVPWTPGRLGRSPQLHALGNGRLTSLVTDAGGGGLRWQDVAVTRWAADGILDDAGVWVYVRDEDSGALWSVTAQPTGIPGHETDVIFHCHMAEYRSRHQDIAIRLDVSVAPGDDVEIRRLQVTNESDRPRRITLTSYGEVVLAPSRDDAQHPAFSKLFVETTGLPEMDALLFRRRQRDPGGRSLVLIHHLVRGSDAVKCSGFETSREHLLGRYGDVRAPCMTHAVMPTGAVHTLDTVMSVQATVELAPYATERLAFVTVVGTDAASVAKVAARHHTCEVLDWRLVDAGEQAGREAADLGMAPEEGAAFQRLLSAVVYRPAAMRAMPRTIAANRLGQPALWRFAISGDVPILLVLVEDASASTLANTVARAHQLWRRRGIDVDVVFVSTEPSGYVSELTEKLQRMLRGTGAHDALGGRGGLHVLHRDHMQDEEYGLLEAAAALILRSDAGSLPEQLAAASSPPPELPRFVPAEVPPHRGATPAVERPGDLLFDNGIGGFTPDGREYVIHLRPGQSTPAPWSNILANPEFGSLVTEAGGGYTWALNAGENRLTTWRNDPVTDVPSEVLYLRDEETAVIWTPTPLPLGRDLECQIRHGAGYSEWVQRSQGLEQRLTVFVPPDLPVKIVRLRLRNLLPTPRRLTATYYAEWVLGRLRATTAPMIVPAYNAAVGALTATCGWNPDFAGQVAFLAADREPHGVTCDRMEFLGRNGGIDRPAALERWGLSGNVDAGVDPCAALQVHLELTSAGDTETFFLLGQEQRSPERVHELVERLRTPGALDEQHDALKAQWERRLSAVQVHTPDAALDVMLNRWLLYQTVASRMFARTGFYQSSGAYGFRDQLQDVMALVMTEPGLAREHLLRAAAQQFDQGDVCHWWHPPQGRGVRTRCSDDFLWLPYVVSYYVERTGDDAVLDEKVSFLEGPLLSAAETERYGLFDRAAETHTLFEHCRRAIANDARRGSHKLPLMRQGDWNDGMNRIGSRGRGESVWLAWFAIATRDLFARVCAARGERETATSLREDSEELRHAVEATAWDGRWYVRAYGDDGRPWGAASCEEGRIDSIAQSWAVLSGAAPPDRARAALDAAAAELVRESDGVVRLLWPPFDHTPRDPGYIKAYPPGIRENGGQYTHAATWLAWAFAASGGGDAAGRIFSIINPIDRARTAEAVSRYRVEPYVIAADVGTVPPHLGRGGWTWYTGSAAWAYRLGVEAILGLRRMGDVLLIDPCIPSRWSGFEAVVRLDGGVLEIAVDNPRHVTRGVESVLVDDDPIVGNRVPVPGSGVVCRVRVRLGQAPAAHVVDVAGSGPRSA